MTIPAPQAERLLTPVHAVFASAAAEARYTPCWALMLAGDGIDEAMAGVTEKALAGEGIAALIHNSAKPGRGPGTVVAHASAAWSTARLEDEADAVAADLAGLVRRHIDLGETTMAMAHRWRYAKVARVCTRGPEYDADAALGIAGDWCLGPDVEDAFHSGIAAARALLIDAVRAKARRSV